MKKRGTFLLSLVLVLSLCLGMMPAAAFAESEPAAEEMADIVAEEKAVDVEEEAVVEDVVEEEAPEAEAMKGGNGNNKLTATYVSNYPANCGLTDSKVTDKINKPEAYHILTLKKAGFATPEGYEFDGWNEAADGSGTPHPAGEKCKRTITEDITLYAQWKAVASQEPVEEVYYVEYHTGYWPEMELENTSKSLPYTQAQLDSDAHYDIAPDSQALGFAIPNGYHFVRWEEPQLAKAVDETAPVCTLYAIWDVNETEPTYTVLYFSHYPENTLEAKSGSIDFPKSELEANKHYGVDPGCDELKFVTPEGYRFVEWTEIVKTVKSESSSGTWCRLEANWEPIGDPTPAEDFVRFQSGYPEEPWYNAISTYPRGRMPAAVTKDVPYDEDEYYFNYEPEEVGIATPFGYMFDGWMCEMSEVPIIDDPIVCKGTGSLIMRAADAVESAEPVMTLTARWMKIGIEYVTNYPEGVKLSNDSIVLPSSPEAVEAGDHLRVPLRHTGFATPSGYRFVRWEAVYDQPIDPRPPIDEVRGVIEAKSVKAVEDAAYEEEQPVIVKPIEEVLIEASDVALPNFYVRAVWAKTTTHSEKEPEETPEEPEPVDEPEPEPTPEPDPATLEEDDAIGPDPGALSGAEVAEETEGDTPQAEYSPLTGGGRDTALWLFCSLLSLAGIAVLLNGKRREE